MYDIDAAKMAEAIQEQFWPHFKTTYDEKNKNVVIHGPTRPIMEALHALKEFKVFSGIILKDPNGVRVHFTTGYTPRGY